MATPTTLPASFTAGQVLTAAQMNDLRGAFRILQVIEGTTSTQVVTTSTSYVTTNLTASITPSATSSKVLILVNSPSGKDSTTNGINTALFRGTVAGTNLAESLLYAGANSTYMMSTFSFLDSPNIISATAYTLGIKSGSASTSIYANADNKRSSIILMEISA